MPYNEEDEVKGTVNSELPDEETDESPDGTDRPEFEELGYYAPFPWSPEKMYTGDDLSEDLKSAFQAFSTTAARMDMAARRFEVEQVWEAKLFDRGYQHLLERPSGGWLLPGQNSKWGPAQQLQRHNLCSTNIYSKTGDILCGAICREVPRVQFFPNDPDYNPDVTAAEAANCFKDVYTKNSNLRKVMQKAARELCTGGRVMFWTRYVIDAQAYGWEAGEDDEPVSPETESAPGDDSPVVGGQATPFAPEIAEEEGEERQQPEKPRGVEITSAYGKLAGKVPIGVDEQGQMIWAQIYEDMDISMASAMFPWIKDKIAPGGTGTGEVELDRIARMNVKISLQGAYVTGDSLVRDVTVQWTWVRPAMYFDKQVKEAVRDELKLKFPDGALVARAGKELAFVRNECLDDSIVVIHAVEGEGQNRRSLLDSTLSLQKTLNNWVDLMNGFFTRTTPRRYYDSESFDIEKLKEQDNVPGGSTQFLARPGVPFSELMGQDPNITHQPSLPEFIKWFEGELNDDLSGALASLYGGAVDQNTVGGAQIQRDQALGRIGTPWQFIQQGFAQCFRQAVQWAAKCRKNDVDDVIPGKGRIRIELSKMKGNVLCTPDYDANFPESWSQREGRFTELWASVPTNPASAALLKTPKALKACRDALRLQDLGDVPGASSVDKQEGEFQILLKSGPVPNPEKQRMQRTLDEAVEGMKSEMQAGTHDPEQVKAAAPMMNEMEQKMNGLADEVSTVPVRQDKSENHLVEADTCFDWMNSMEGRRYEHGNDEQKAGFANVYLHYKEHAAMAEKLAAPPQAPKPSESMSIDISKMPVGVQIQALGKVGIQAKPEDFAEAAQTDSAKKIKERAAPKVIANLTKS